MVKVIFKFREKGVECKIYFLGEFIFGWWKRIANAQIDATALQERAGGEIDGMRLFLIAWDAGIYL